MIKISYKEDKLIKEVKIEGHAMFDEYGKDIVCSSVSSIATTTINNILALDKNAIKYDCSDAYILITNKDSEMASKLLKQMLNMFSELEKDYPENIKIGG